MSMGIRLLLYISFNYVLETSGITFHEWQWWAVFALIMAAETCGYIRGQNSRGLKHG